MLEPAQLFLFRRVPCCCDCPLPRQVIYGHQVVEIERHATNNADSLTHFAPCTAVNVCTRVGVSIHLI
jgi:hypothetical protein